MTAADVPTKRPARDGVWIAYSDNPIGQFASLTVFSTELAALRHAAVEGAKSNTVMAVRRVQYGVDLVQQVKP